MSDPLNKQQGQEPPEDSVTSPEEAPKPVLVSDVLSPSAEAMDVARLTLDIDFNSLAALAIKGKQVENGLVLAERVLELRNKAEAQRVQHFREAMQAVIEAKVRDPDEIERRQAAGFRRSLMSIVAVCALLFGGGVVAVGYSGGSIVTFGTLASLAVLSLVLTAILASGGLLTPRNVQSLIRTAMRSVMDTVQEPPTGDKVPSPRRKGARRRRP